MNPDVLQSLPYCSLVIGLSRPDQHPEYVPGGLYVEAHPPQDRQKEICRISWDGIELLEQALNPNP